MDLYTLGAIAIAAFVALAITVQELERSIAERRQRRALPPPARTSSAVRILPLDD